MRHSKNSELQCDVLVVGTGFAGLAAAIQSLNSGVEVIVLALGSLLITPILRYVSTGLMEARISEKMLLKQYAADAAVEYSLWQLKHNIDGLIDQLNAENLSYNTSITVNGIEVSVTTAVNLQLSSIPGRLAQSQSPASKKKYQTATANIKTAAVAIILLFLIF